MIDPPINDVACLGLLWQMACELVLTTLVINVAHKLRTRENVIQWIRSLPQSDDDGSDEIQAVACDVLQRVRLFPSDPNCFERAFAALLLLEAIDPQTRRALVSIEKPARHTAIVEKRGDGPWQPIDLFPRRNGFGWGDVLQGVHAVHTYVGKPILKFYLGDTGGKVADEVGRLEHGLDAKPPAQQQPRPQQKPAPPKPADAKLEQPAPGAAQPPAREPSRSSTAAQETTQHRRRPFTFARPIDPYRNQGGTNGEQAPTSGGSCAQPASAGAAPQTPQCWRVRR